MSQLAGVTCYSGRQEKHWNTSPVCKQRAPQCCMDVECLWSFWCFRNKISQKTKWLQNCKTCSMLIRYLHVYWYNLLYFSQNFLHDILLCIFCFLYLCWKIFSLNWQSLLWLSKTQEISRMLNYFWYSDQSIIF